MNQDIKVWKATVMALAALVVGFGLSWCIFGRTAGSAESADDGQKVTAFPLATVADSISYAYGISTCPADDDIRSYLLEAGSEARYVDDFFDGMTKALLTENDDKTTAYELGYQTGLQTKFSLAASAGSILPSGQTFSMAGVVKGIDDYRKGQVHFVVDGCDLTPSDIDDYLYEVSQRAQRKAVGEKQKASEAFIAAKADEAGVHALGDGVLYKVVTVGKGSVPPAGSRVSVEYTAMLSDGKVFDSSHGKAVDFAVDDVVPGLTSALSHMPEGSEWEIYIPWDQAYGAQGSGPIPPYSALTFKVKLIKILK